jgi:hypothetical protein
MLGDAVAQQVGLPSYLGTPVAGTLVFVVSYVICGIAASLLRRWDRKRLLGAPRGLVDRTLGGVFGGLRGGLVTLLLIILVGWLDAARDMGAVSGLEAVPQVEDSMVAEAGSTLVAMAAQAAIGDDVPGGSLIVSLVSRPSQTLGGMQAVIDHPALLALQRDRLFWSLVENGATGRALNQGSFLRLAEDANLRLQLANMGVITRQAAANSETFRAYAEHALEQAGPRIKGLRNDPQLRALASNPEVIAMVESGDTLGLLTHPDVARLVAQVSDGDAGSAADPLLRD